MLGPRLAIDRTRELFRQCVAKRYQETPSYFSTPCAAVLATLALVRSFARFGHGRATNRARAENMFATTTIVACFCCCASTLDP